MRSEGETFVPQPQEVYLKEHFDKVEELKEDIHKRDMQIIEDRLSKGEEVSGWDAFARMMESDTGKELGFDEYNSKTLQPAREHTKEKEKPRKDFTPLKIMCKFIENDGDPSSYLEAMSISYPEHPFCQILITCETPEQFSGKLKALEQKLPPSFREKGQSLA